MQHAWLALADQSSAITLIEASLGYSYAVKKDTMEWNFLG